MPIFQYLLFINKKITVNIKLNMNHIHFFFQIVNIKLTLKSKFDTNRAFSMYPVYQKEEGTKQTHQVTFTLSYINPSDSY